MMGERSQQWVASRYAAADVTLEPWAVQNELHIYTRYRDEDVRTVPVVDASGNEFQIWLEPDGDRFRVRAWNGRKREAQRAWTSEAVPVEELRGALDDALARVRSWIAATGGRGPCSSTG